jgi:uncharacterized protein
MADRFLLQPFRFGAQKQATAAQQPVYNGVAVTEDADRHLRDKILAVLFTAPGERVNNPRFGVGLDRRVFEPLSDLQLAALEYQVSQGLRRDLGAEVTVHGVDVTAAPERGELLLEIRYSRRADRVPRNLEIVL